MNVKATEKLAGSDKLPMMILFLVLILLAILALNRGVLQLYITIVSLSFLFYCTFRLYQYKVISRWDKTEAVLIEGCIRYVFVYI